jgi:hypothetical protein
LNYFLYFYNQNKFIEQYIPDSEHKKFQRSEPKIEKVSTRK